MHEIGHNFGARHDDDSGVPTCYPDGPRRPSVLFAVGDPASPLTPLLACLAEAGDRFVMYHVSVTGSSPNNDKFSACSAAAMKAAVLASAAACFAVPPTAYCGDGVVDYADGEECDAGVYGGDACCSAACTLVPPAVCADRACRPRG